MTVSPEEYAARLRLIRRFGAMLRHPEQSKVLDDETFGAILDALNILVPSTCTPGDAEAHARAGLNDLRVIWSETKQRHVFAYCETRAQ